MFTIREQQRVPFFYAIVNPILHFLVLRFGIGTHGAQDVLRILRVRGRKSGRIYETPVRIANWNGQRYVISMLGKSQWVRNLRADGDVQLLANRMIEPVHASEVVGKDKTAFLTWYCLHPEFAQRARYALKVNTDRLTSVEIERLCQLWPVFRLQGT
ncbi:MAG: nitroreductase/quinone reductase family protein [Chloroflexota bacterium]|nr:nitroreductase/quinone reductase family protein [Anaerolineales bacterium]